MSSNQGGRTVQSEAEARECFSAMTAQNQCVWAFARTKGVCTKSLYRWRTLLNISTPSARRWLQTEQRAADAPAWVELVAAAQPPPPTAPKPTPARYEVVIGTVVIRVGDDFHDDTLARLLRVAAAC